jgi:hypothetical protein
MCGVKAKGNMGCCPRVRGCRVDVGLCKVNEGIIIRRCREDVNTLVF